jgi:ferredoxin-type protein NapF
MFLRRTVQVLSLSLFLLTLASAVFSLSPWLPEDLFLNLDPLIMAGTVISARAFAWAFVPALIVLASGLFLGRAFCGYICPLGTTIDGTDRIIKPRTGKSQTGKPGTGRPPPVRLRPVKYWVLAFTLGGAFAGVSFVFLASPLSLATRLYGLVVGPVLTLLTDRSLDLLRPLAQGLGLEILTFAGLESQRFATQWFIIIFFGLIFGAVFLAPRFWCRYLCPSGALLGLISRFSLLKRRVSEECIDCGKCQAACPMNAIPEEASATHHRECVLCRTCQEVCPVGAVRFLPGPAPESVPARTPAATRRQFLFSAAAGAGAAVVSLTGLTSAAGKSGPGEVAPPGLIRPPASLPELSFSARCVRCGECMAACPTNTLQPIWLERGLGGLFSPAMTPRRGPCDPHCHRCAEVCPTGAIRLPGPEERVWAKTGTAVVLRERCLAWEHQKKCLVCDEVCPFDAIDFRQEEGLPFAVPHVNEDKCAGCGFCEHYCPIRNRAAIIVTAQGAIRLKQGSFEEEARRQGLSLSIKETGPEQGAYPGPPAGEQGPAPGFSQEEDPGAKGKLPPGFTE